MTRIPLLFLLLSMALPACQEDKIEPDLFGGLAGEVRFESGGLPASNVIISTSPATSSLLTAADGTFAFAALKTGTYTVRAELNGYLTTSESVTVSENQTATVVLKLSPDLQVNSPPTAAHNPFPADGSADQPLSLELMWQADDPDENDELTYDVYLFDMNLQNQTLAGSALVEPILPLANLRYGTTYFWQVVVSDGEADPVYGPVWQFATAPFPSHAFVFSKIENGVFEIYSGNVADEFYQLTTNGSNYRPRFSPLGNRIAYINANYPAKRLYVMNRDGSDPTLVETPFPPDSDYEFEMDFTWSPDGTQLLYMRGRRLYKINIDGTGPALFHELADEDFVEVDWAGAGNKIAARTVGDLPYQSRILLFDENGNLLSEIVPDLPGSIGGPAFSVDGNAILYTRDTTGFEMPDGRQLESHVFLKDINTGIEKDLSFDKPDGFNDLDPRFSPNGALIIFTHTNNFPNSQKDIYIMTSQGEGRQKLFSNAEMPDWTN